MDIGFSEIIRIGFADGLLWFPFVLGVGLLFTYFKEIDVSVDGIAVISGIGCAFVWRSSESYMLSIISGIMIGIVCSTIVCFMQTIFRIPSLMAGIIFSLIAHAISVLLIGESLVLPNTHLITGFGIVQWWQIILVFGIILLSLFFYNTRFGIAARKLGNGSVVNTVYSAGLLKWSGYALSGFLYGIGGSIYAHSQGMAKSGGSFEFLLVSLSAYLCTVKIWDIIAWTINVVGGLKSFLKNTLSSNKQIIESIIYSPAIKALIGAILFETLLFFTIANSPNPLLWKLIFASLLLLALAKLDLQIPIKLSHIRGNDKIKELKIKDISVHYDIGSEQRKVFINASCDFSLGINLIRGANGTGKSTLLKTIAGNVNLNGGRIMYNGHDLNHIAKHLRPCFLLQQNPMDTLAPDLTVIENLFVAFDHSTPFTFGFGGQKVLAVLLSELKKLGVSPIKPESDLFWQKPVITLSGGEAHCVALYCALLSGAQVLLVDEPTTGLDVENFKKLTSIIAALASRHIILLTSHDSRVDAIANKKFIVGSGKITLNEG